MRSLFIGLCAISTVLILLASPGDASRGRGSRNDEIAIQPLASESGLVLFSSPGSARVESRRGSARVGLAPDEQLATIAETARGWVAAGVRQEKQGSSIFLVSEESGSPERLPAPRRRYLLQLRPVLLVLDGDLLGAAWLEGKDHRSLAVRFAEWTGVQWSQPSTVSRPGAGSQTGLTGAVLEGGESLLAWSRFDGKDDEIYWSLREGDRWSAPARLGPDNAAPDVTPVLATSGEGATLVWARLESSEYHLVSRRFDSRTWAPERRVGGPGSLFPSLIRAEGRLFAIYRSAVPRGWSVTELAEDASAARHAFTAQQSSSRPILTSTGSEARLEWRRPRRSANLRWELRQP